MWQEESTAEARRRRDRKEPWFCRVVPVTSSRWMFPPESREVGFSEFLSASASPRWIFLNPEILFQVKLHPGIGDFDHVAVLELLPGIADPHAVQARGLTLVARHQQVAVTGARDHAGAVQCPQSGA